MHLSTTSLLVILVFLIILSGFFSGSEIGMMSINRYRLKHLVKKQDKRAIRVNQMLSQPDKLLSVVLIGNTLANIVASTIATLIGQKLYGDMGVAIATIILTIIVIVVAEMGPKTVAAIYSQQIAFLCVVPLKFFQNLFLPMVYVMTGITNACLRLVGISLNTMQKEALSGEELRSVVHEAGGLMPIEHKSMLISLIDLEQATVEDIMVPIADIVGINLNLPWHEILDMLETAQHTRLPLYRDSIDHLVGMIHVRSLLNLAIEGELSLETLERYAELPYFIPSGTPLNLQIVNFRKIKKRSAFVVNEYGDLLGLVTMEDILEEIVGEFTTDIADLSRNIMPQEDGSVIVDASITLRQLNRLMSWHLPMIGPRTLSGLIIESLGIIPSAECCLTIEGYRIEVLRVADNTIKSVRMTRKSRKR